MSMKPLNIIVACAVNRVIGRAGKLPWKIPEDWDYFLKQTKGGTVIFGRKTFEEFNHPFPECRTVVLTRNPDWKSEGVIVAPSLEEGIDKAQAFDGEIWISGGQQVYDQAISLADTLYLTLVHDEVQGDAFFPAWETYFPKIISQNESSNENYRYTFIIIEK